MVHQQFILIVAVALISTAMAAPEPSPYGGGHDQHGGGGHGSHGGSGFQHGEGSHGSDSHGHGVHGGGHGGNHHGLGQHGY
ncbi:hypothetical protein LSTR_LSTR008856 [Laodelphax striatellus]|uniref:Uncharacterized protein n=1 Tax=Laodelphax striatellus TaxID=195883 RepID=A0A482WTM1_LAOST|nr:hypothetical protein LSTR_LSTR008856 [Laodelphax striatellus]